MASRMVTVFSVFCILFAIVWTVIAASVPTGISATLVLFGILFIILSVYRLYILLRKAPEPPRVDAMVRTQPDGEPVHRASANGYCPYCGTPLDSDYEYCPLCGKRI